MIHKKTKKKKLYREKKRNIKDKKRVLFFKIQVDILEKRSGELKVIFHM